MSRYENILDPDEQHQKIEDDYKIAQIAQLRVDTFLKYMDIGFPISEAAKLADLNINKEEVAQIAKSRKLKKK